MEVDLRCQPMLGRVPTSEAAVDEHEMVSRCHCSLKQADVCLLGLSGK